MTFDEYQAFVRELSIYPKTIVLFTPSDPDTGGRLPWVYPVLGLAEEAGEVAGKFAKFVRDGKPLDELREMVKKELGDVGFMLTAVATELGLTLEEIFAGNVEKLSSRRDRGVLSGSGDNR